MGLAKAAFIPFGEVNTPRELIERKALYAKKLLTAAGIDLLSVDPVSDDAEGRDVSRARNELSGQDFDLIIICIAGWIPSHAVVSVIDEYRHVPMVLWGLCGWMEGDRLVTTADQAGTSALRKPLEDLGFTFAYVYEVIGAKPNTERIVHYAMAAKAARALRRERVGMMGFRDMSLYGTLHDGVSLRRKIGVEVEAFDMLEMVQNLETVDESEAKELERFIRESWVFMKEPAPETLRKGIGYFLALKKRVEARGYGAVSLIDVDGMKKLLNFPPAMVFMLLDQRLNVCTVPENDAMGAVTQLMVRHATGQIAAYLEFYEFMEDRVLLGVPDFVPKEVVDGPLTVLPAKFGLLGEGVMNVSKLKTGTVTIARLTSSGDRYALHIATGRAVTPRKWEEAGWAQPAPQLPGLEIILDTPVADFTARVMSQHYIVSYGDNTEVLRSLCSILGVEVLR